MEGTVRNVNFTVSLLPGGERVLLDVLDIHSTLKKFPT
jgi:hypothetical protein